MWNGKLRLTAFDASEDLIYRVPVEEISMLEKMAMVESQELANLGLATGQISDFDPDLKKANYIVLGNNVHRICSPTDGSPYPLIFYTKDDSVDGAPSLSLFTFGFASEPDR